MADSLEAKARLDSLEKARWQVRRDMNAANSVLGLGWAYPNKLHLFGEDTIPKLKVDNYEVVRLENGRRGVVLLPVNLDKRKFYQMVRTTHDGFNSIKYGVINIFRWLNDEAQVEPRVLSFEKGKKVYLSEWKMFTSNFFGYLITALAISLGAPFWFDLLSKLVQIRGSIQQRVEQGSGNAGSATSDPSHPLNRKA